MQKVLGNKQKPLPQAFLVCIVKNNGHKVRVADNRVFCTICWQNTFTNEQWEEETEITNFTRSQLMDYLGQ